MATSVLPQRNRPDVEFVERAAPTQAPDREETRFLFSPFLSYPTIYDACGFMAIRRGIIRPVKHYDQPCRATKAIRDAFNISVLQSYDTGDDLFPREAATVAEGLIRTHAKTGEGVPTGLVVLTPMQALDTERDYSLIELVQDLLWPVNYPTAKEHEEYLGRIDLQSVLEDYGTDVATLIDDCRSIILSDAIPGSKSYCWKTYSQVKAELSDYAARKEARGEVSEHERQCCQWIGVADPVRPASASEGLATASDLMTMMAEGQKQNSEMLKLLMAQVMQNQGGDQVGMLTVIQQMMETQNRLIEKIGETPQADESDVPNTRQQRLERKQQESKERNGK